MTAQLIQLNAHENMSPAECLNYSARNADDYQDVLVVGVDQDGHVMLNSSHMSREFAVFILLEALDQARDRK